MGKRYKVEMSDAQTGKGLLTWVTVGESVVVDGEAMVRLGHGAIVPDRGWTDTLADANERAASRIELIGHKLLRQAEEMRAEAARPEATT